MGPSGHAVGRGAMVLVAVVSSGRQWDLVGRSASGSYWVVVDGQWVLAAVGPSGQWVLVNRDKTREVGT